MATQDLRRLKNSVAMAIFAVGLTATVGDLSSQTRTRVRDWMDAKGLDTTWITNQTLIRQVLQYLLENLNWPVITFGPHRV